MYKKLNSMGSVGFLAFWFSKKRRNKRSIMRSKGSKVTK